GAARGVGHPGGPRRREPPLWEVDDQPGYEDDNQAPLEPLYHDVFAARWRRFVPAATAFLLALLVGLLVWNLPHDTGTPVDLAANNPAPAKEPALTGQVVMGWP